MTEKIPIIPILNVSRIILLAISILMLLTTVFASTFVGTDERGLFGYRLFGVDTDFMKPTLSKGDMIFVKHADVCYPGDVIVYRTADAHGNGRALIRAVRESVIHNGRAAYITYEMSVGIDELEPAYTDDIIGKAEFVLPGAGAFCGFVKSPIGYMLLIMLPFMLLIVGEILRIVYTSHKAEEPQRYYAAPIRLNGTPNPPAVRPRTAAPTVETIRPRTAPVQPESAKRPANIPSQPARSADRTVNTAERPRRTYPSPTPPTAPRRQGDTQTERKKP